MNDMSVTSLHKELKLTCLDISKFNTHKMKMLNSSNPEAASDLLENVEEMHSVKS